MAFDLIWLAVVFLIIALIAYLLGARGFAWFSADMAKLLVWIFVILFVLSLIARYLF
jgi:uncharacterized membrane protein YtjA (UPF0391 family)